MAKDCPAMTIVSFNCLERAVNWINLSSRPTPRWDICDGTCRPSIIPCIHESGVFWHSSVDLMPASRFPAISMIVFLKFKCRNTVLSECSPLFPSLFIKKNHQRHMSLLLCSSPSYCFLSQPILFAHPFPLIPAKSRHPLRWMTSGSLIPCRKFNRNLSPIRYDWHFPQIFKRRTSANPADWRFSIKSQWGRYVQVTWFISTRSIRLESDSTVHFSFHSPIQRSYWERKKMKRKRRSQPLQK